MDVVFACCIIHNHIIGVDPLDSIMSNGLRGSPLANERKSRRVQQSQREVQEKNREWVKKWDDICRKMWEDYNAMGWFHTLYISWLCNGLFWFHIFKTFMWQLFLTPPTSGGHSQCKIYYLRYLQMRFFMEISNPTHLNMNHMLK